MLLAQIVSGAWAGTTAALGMAVVWMALSASLGTGATFPLALVASTLLGRSALDGGVAPLVVGGLLHLVVGAAWGVLYASLLPTRASGAGAAAVGALFSFIIFFFMLALTQVASPLFFAEADWGSVLVANLVFGLGLGLTVPARHRVEERAEHHHHGPIVPTS